MAFGQVGLGEQFLAQWASSYLQVLLSASSISIILTLNRLG